MQIIKLRVSHKSDFICSETFTTVLNVKALQTFLVFYNPKTNSSVPPPLPPHPHPPRDINVHFPFKFY